MLKKAGHQHDDSGALTLACLKFETRLCPTLQRDSVLYSCCSGEDSCHHIHPVGAGSLFRERRRLSKAHPPCTESEMCPLLTVVPYVLHWLSASAFISAVVAAYLPSGGCPDNMCWDGLPHAFAHRTWSTLAEQQQQQEPSRYTGFPTFALPLADLAFSSIFASTAGIGGKVRSLLVTQRPPPRQEVVGDEQL